MRKIWFFGTPELSASVLKSLIASDQDEVVFVVTNPDKPVGRKQILTPSPVKVLWENYNIPVFTPEKIRNNTEFLNAISAFDADYFVVVAYGKILPKNVIEMPKKMCINIHGSILPKYRGASPIQSALLAGDTETGVTIMKMDEKMDEGDSIFIEKIPIDERENTKTLFEKFADISPKALKQALDALDNEIISPQPQNHNEATYCKKITKSDAKIDVNASCDKIFYAWKAYTPWPGIFGFLDWKRIIFEDISRKKITDISAKNGEILQYENSLAIKVSDGIIIVHQLKMEGKKSTTAQEFLQWNHHCIWKIIQ